MAYVITISRASQDFSGLAWVRYDSEFQRNAAESGIRNWSAINPSIYSFCFTGKAAIAARCDLRLSTRHGTKQCPLQEDTDPELPVRLKAVETTVLSLASHSTGDNSGTRAKVNKVCRLFNNDACRFKLCKYKHVCSSCGEKHKAIFCLVNPRTKVGPAALGQGTAFKQNRARPY